MLVKIKMTKLSEKNLLIGIDYSFEKENVEIDEISAEELSFSYAGILLKECQKEITEEIKEIGLTENYSGVVYGSVKFPVIMKWLNEHNISEDNHFIVKASWVLLKNDQEHLKNRFHATFSIL